MSAETQKVLEMVAEGKISPADADRLLEKLSQSTASSEPATAPETPAGKAGKKFLRILVDKPGRDQVNLRIPISFFRAGMAWAVIPDFVRERMAERGVDPGHLLNLRKMANMNPEELDAFLEQLNLDIEKGDGKKVRIFAE